jgi:sulfate adenylyltransferase subunit 1 (EFTu-like GTPase family)
MSHDHHDYRGYAGQVAGGILRPGDDVVVLPGGRRSQIAGIDTYDGELDAAYPTMSVTVRLADQLDVSRGDMICLPEDPAQPARELEAVVCWMSAAPLTPRGRYVIKHTTRSAKAVVDRLEYRVDVNTLHHDDAERLALNEIGRVHLRVSTALVVDPYAVNRTTGSFILIDEATNDTVGAGMIISAR